MIGACRRLLYNHIPNIAYKPDHDCVYSLVANGARNLAVGDEDGTIHIIDTARDGAHPGTNIRPMEINADDGKEADHDS